MYFSSMHRDRIWPIEEVIDFSFVLVKGLYFLENDIDAWWLLFLSAILLMTSLLQSSKLDNL